MVWPNNAYVLSSGQTSVFFGGEIADVAWLERHRHQTRSGDGGAVARQRVAAGPSLVMDHRKAVAGAGVLDARVLVPVHDAHASDLLSLVFRRHGSAAEAREMATDQLDVVCLAPGTRWMCPTL